jgi:tol-pal system protein YbgF
MVFSKWQNKTETLWVAMAPVILIPLVVGCSGSEELTQQQAEKIAAYERQLEELRTENTTLRQRMFKLEQDNKNLEARLSETEAKVIAERERADKAESSLSAVKRQPVEPSQTTTTKTGGYDEALNAVHERKFDEAISKFEALLSTIGDDFADNCHYWIGECLYAKKQYHEAVKRFAMVTNYPKSEKLADAHFMMAQCYARMGDKAKAKEQYEKTAKDYPTSPRAELAKQRAQKL